MKETTPEIEGWVDRDKLLDISGRGRERQISLAKEFGIENFEPPAGGCLLTDPNFSKKMFDFVKYDKNFILADIGVLKYGRSFRLPENAKLIISRNKDENAKLREVENPKFITIYLRGVMGPISMISATATEAERELAVRLILTYSKTESDTEYEVSIEDKVYKAKPLASKEDAREYMLKLN
jgi:tRNA-specific 2-thiouridylase